MRTLLCAVLLSGSFLFAQENSPSSMSQDDSRNSKEQVTVRGCVTRSNGDYILMKQDPAVSYELQGGGGTELRKYLGQRVEVTGRESPTLSSSSDALTRAGSAAPVTLTVTSIKSLSKECRAD
jgi:hypothetical protein